MKRFFKTFLCLVLLLSGCATTQEPLNKSEYKIWVVGDPHYIDPSLTGGPQFEKVLSNSDGRLSQYTEEIIDAFIYQCLNEKPDVVIFVGDLTFNGEKVSHESFAKKLKTLKDKNIIPLVIPGNHDIENPHSYNYSGKDVTYTTTITPEDFAKIYKDCGYQTPSILDENSLSYLYKLSDECWILMLDSAEYEHNNTLAASAGGRIREEQLHWMEEVLKEAQEKGARVITVMHHTLTNMTGSSDYQIKNASTVQRMCLEYDVIANLCGHSHAQYIRQLEKQKGTITDIMTSALIIYCHQFGEITWKPNESFEYQSKPLDMDAYVQKEKITDPFFADFDSSSRAFFQEYSTKRLGSWFEGSGLTEEEQTSLIELKGLQNLYLFTGRMEEFFPIYEDSGLAPLVESLPEEQANRLLNAMKRYPKNGTHVYISLEENGVD